MELGKYNILRVERKTDFGLFLEDEERNEVLLPNRYVTPDLAKDDEIKVFIYKDSEDRIVATTEEPKLVLGEFTCLKATDIAPFGAFMDWGLQKDLLIPNKEQRFDIEKDEEHIVCLFIDEQTDRITGSTKINKYLSKDHSEFIPWQEVDLMMGEKTDLGYEAIINGTHLGLVYHNEVFQKLSYGQKLKGYIKNLREDDKIDLTLQKQGYANVEPNAQRILDILKDNNGSLPYNDKSNPEDISSRFEMSKKTFKKALGTLYKNKQISIEDDGIKLSEPS
jgi:predicted RNA-binding protein (virulence factor B family)